MLEGTAKRTFHVLLSLAMCCWRRRFSTSTKQPMDRAATPISVAARLLGTVRSSHAPTVPTAPAAAAATARATPLAPPGRLARRWLYRESLGVEVEEQENVEEEGALLARVP